MKIGIFLFSAEFLFWAMAASGMTIPTPGTWGSMDTIVGGETPPLRSGFDTGLEGWTSSGGLLSYSANSGNGTGFLSLTDNTNDWMTVYSPALFSGNLQDFSGGTLSFDIRNLNGSPPDLTSAPLFGLVTITGLGGTASMQMSGTGSPPANGLWNNYSTDLLPALWTGDLIAALSNVTRISIVLESNQSNPGEQNGFDNFTLTSVPEPSLFAAVLGIFSLATVILRRRAVIQKPSEPR